MHSSCQTNGIHAGKLGCLLDNLQISSVRALIIIQWLRIGSGRKQVSKMKRGAEAPLIYSSIVLEENAIGASQNDFKFVHTLSSGKFRNCRVRRTSISSAWNQFYHHASTSIKYVVEGYKGVPKLTQDLNLIENTVFSIDYVIFLLNYKVHRIGLFVE